MPEPYYDSSIFARAIGSFAAMLRAVSDSSSSSSASSEGSLRLSPTAMATLAAAITAASAVVFIRGAVTYRDIFLGNAVDDAYISFRYLENLASGHGLVYNAGERVEGFSNLLWIVLLLPFRLAGLDVVFASRMLGISLGVATIALGVFAAWRLFSIRSPIAIALVAFLPATSGYFTAWSIGGLEGSLYAFLLAASWCRYHIEIETSRRFPLSAVLFVMLAMTRPEGLFIALAALGYHLFSARLTGRSFREPSVLRFVVVLVALIGIYELFRFVYYGPHLFPNSVRAKVGVSYAAFERGIAYFHDRFASPYLPLLAPLFLSLRRNRFPALMTGSVLVAAQVGLVVIAGGDWSFGRLFAPIVPLGAVVLAGAAAELDRADSSWRSFPVQTALGVAMAGYVAFAAFVTNKLGEAQFFGPYAPYDAERIWIGKWLREHAPPNTKVAVYAAGQIPYYSRLYAHDMLGLNDAHIASIEPSSMGKGVVGHEKSDPEYTLNVVKPDIIIDAQLVPGLQSHPDFASRYQLLHGFRYNTVFMTQPMADLMEPTIPR